MYVYVPLVPNRYGKVQAVHMIPHSFSVFVRKNILSYWNFIFKSRMKSFMSDCYHKNIIVSTIANYVLRMYMWYNRWFSIWIWFMIEKYVNKIIMLFTEDIISNIIYRIFWISHFYLASHANKDCFRKNDVSQIGGLCYFEISKKSYA